MERKLRYLEIEPSSVVQMESFDTHLTTKIEKKEFRKNVRKDPPGSKFFFTYFVGHQRSKTDGFKKDLKKIFEPKGHFRAFFEKQNWSTMLSGKFHVDPKIFSP